MKLLAFSGKFVYKDLYTKFEVPENLRATLVKPYLDDKAKLVVARLEPSLADDYNCG